MTLQRGRMRLMPPPATRPVELSDMSGPSGPGLPLAVAARKHGVADKRHAAAQFLEPFGPRWQDLRKQTLLVEVKGHVMAEFYAPNLWRTSGATTSRFATPSLKASP